MEDYDEEAIASILTSYMAHSEDKNPNSPSYSKAFCGEVSYSYAFQSSFLKRSQVGSYGIGRFGDSFLRCA